MLFLLTLLLVLPQSGYCESTLILPSRTVVIKLPYENATIPCNYTCPDNVTTTTWTRGEVTDPTVLYRSSVGNVKPGSGYEGSVSFGERCSLIIKSPNLTYDGNFTITIHNQKDSSETVRVIVVGENATVYSSDTRPAKEGKGCEDRANNTADNKTSPVGDKPEKVPPGYIAAVVVYWIASVICAFVLGKGDITLLQKCIEKMVVCVRRCNGKLLCGARIVAVFGLCLAIAGGICIMIAFCYPSRETVRTTYFLEITYNVSSSKTGLGLGIFGTLILVIATISALICCRERNNGTNHNTERNREEEGESHERHEMVERSGDALESEN